MNAITLNVLYGFALLMATIVFHELGHYVSARVKGYPAKFGIDKQGFKVEVDAPIDKLKGIVEAGIFTGYFPFTVWFAITGRVELVGIVVMFYYTLKCLKEKDEWEGEYLKLSRKKNSSKS